MGWIERYIRVLRIARKPTGEELKRIAKVSAIGIAIIGTVGFLIDILFVLF